MPGPRRALAHIPDDEIRSAIMEGGCLKSSIKYGVTAQTMSVETHRLGIVLKRGRPIGGKRKSLPKVAPLVEPTPIVVPRVIETRRPKPVVRPRKPRKHEPVKPSRGDNPLMVHSPTYRLTQLTRLSIMDAAQHFGVPVHVIMAERDRLGIATAMPNQAPVKKAAPPVEPVDEDIPLSVFRINRLLEIPKAELAERLRHVRAQDLAVELKVTLDEMEIVVSHWKLNDPKPAPLPPHTVWRPELDQSYPLFMAQGVEHDDAVARIERAVRWAVRWGCMHINNAGELVREMDPVRLARPAEWRP